MRVIRLILFALLGVFIYYVKFASAPNGTGSAPAVGSSAPVAVNPAVPQKVLRVLNIVRTTGQPPEGYVGGRVFENREGRLPSDGDYREFDVDPHQGQRNAERIIVEWNSKKAWYTADHYQTFTPLP